MKFLERIALFILLNLCSISLWAQPKQVISWQAEAKKDNQTNQFHLVLQAEILEPGWHFWTLDLQSEVLIPTKIIVTNESEVFSEPHWTVSGEVKQTEDEFFGHVEYYEGDEVSFVRATKLSEGQVIEGTITYQACNQSTCLPPATVPFKVELN